VIRSSMLVESSRRSSILDAFRVPYLFAPDISNGGWEVLRAASGGAELSWPKPAGAPALHSLDGVPFIGSVRPDRELERSLEPAGWTRGAPVLDAAGQRASSVWYATDGSVRLPFDPDELVTSVLSERFIEAASPASARLRALARSLYYTTRPIIPRGLQLALRRRYMAIQDRQAFPSWPIETRLHDFYGSFLAMVEAVAGRPLPYIAPWPSDASWALVLTHDVEHREGYEFIDRVLDVERALGVRSAWYLTPERDYHVSDVRVDSLTCEGFEVGVQGLHHDGRDLDRRRFPERLPAIRRYLERWNASGFRSPSTQRDWELIAELGFDYDSSYSDVARYEPQPGGSGTWLPYFNEALVELPITLPMDHTLFELLREPDEAMWIEKADFLRRQGGMALILTHPDYQLQPYRLASYRRFLEHVLADPAVWVALPREVSAWWRARSATEVVAGPGGWELSGPAADRARLVIGVGQLANASADT
jgi:peptidoglycan/xylan/chitin deacetylase (PgdA/CDA1 family)